MQRKAGGTPGSREPAGSRDETEVHAAAARGVATPGSTLPHRETIQRLFGRHDISGIQAHVGGDAAGAAREMGAAAYATGNHVVLGARADLHTVAHEAAHVVQQRGGVQLKGGIGQEGDAYERHADQVADAVVRGDSAEPILDAMGGGGATPGTAIQRMGKPEGDHAPTSSDGQKDEINDGKREREDEEAEVAEEEAEAAEPRENNQPKKQKVEGSKEKEVPTLLDSRVKQGDPSKVNGAPLLDSRVKRGLFKVKGGSTPQQDPLSKLKDALNRYQSTSLDKDVVDGIRDGRISIRKDVDHSHRWITTTRGDHIYLRDRNSRFWEIQSIEPFGRATMRKE